MTSDDDIEKARSSYFRAYKAYMKTEDAGRPDAALGAAVDRARIKLERIKAGEPTKAGEAHAEIVAAKSLARDWSKLTGTELDVRNESYGKWYVYRWTPGEQPELIGPFVSERTACKKMAAMIR